jgi:hypothetical protein
VAERKFTTLLLVGGGGFSLLILWFVPEYIGSGDFLRAANRARQPNPDSAAFAAHPFIEVFNRSASVLSLPVYVGGTIAFVVACFRRDGLYLSMAAIGTVLMVAVAGMTQAGFAGNLRYVALPAALVCVLAGAGWVAVVRGAARRWGAGRAAAVAVVLAALSVPFVAADVDKLRYDWEVVEYEANFYGPNLKAAIAKGGGEARVKSCGKVFTGPFQVPSVAWRLHMHIDEVVIFPFGPGTALAMGSTELSVDPRYPEYTKTVHWIVGSSCDYRG